MTGRPARWYHGGAPGLHCGDKLLPAAVTGSRRHHQRVAPGLGPALRLLMRNYDPELVYLTSRDIALRIAARWPRGDVYQVAPDGPVRPDPDSDGGGACRSAVILRVVKRGVPPGSGWEDGAPQEVTGAMLREVVARREADARAGGYLEFWAAVSAPLCEFASGYGDADVVDLDRVAGVLARIASFMERIRRAAAAPRPSGRGDDTEREDTEPCT